MGNLPDNMYRLNQPLFLHTAMPVRPTHNLSGKGHGGVVLRHEQFLKDMGTPAVTINNVGYDVDSDGTIVRNPAFIMCDPLSQDATGLMPNSGPIYLCSQMLTRFIEQKRYLLGVVGDAHVTAQNVNQDALSDISLTVEYYNQLTSEEQKRADRYFFDKMAIPDHDTREDDKRRARSANAHPVEKLSGERWLRYEKSGVSLPDNGQSDQLLLVHEANLLHGESPDGEFRDFLFAFEHCIEPAESGGAGLYKWVPYVRDMFERAIRVYKQARLNGETAPDARVVSFHKNDLRPGVPNGLRGTNGNLFEEFLLASQYGMPQGPQHDYQRKVSIYLMGTPFTVLFGTLNALALGFRVRLHMEATFNFDPAGISMIELIRLLRHLFPNAFEAVIGWDKEWMRGPEPVAPDGRTYNEVAREVKALLLQHLQSTGGAKLNMKFFAFGDPNDLRDVFTDLT